MNISHTDNILAVIMEAAKENSAVILNKNHTLDTTTVCGARLALCGHVVGRNNPTSRVGTKTGGVAVDWRYVGMWLVAVISVTRGHKNGAHPTSLSA